MQNIELQGFPLDVAANAKPDAANHGPVECVVICDKEGLKIIVAVFYCQSDDDSVTWVHYVGVDGVEGFESGFMCLMVNDADTDYEHFYISVDGESFSRDAITGKDIELSLRSEDKSAFDALLKMCDSWITFDEDSEAFTARRKRRRQLSKSDEDSTRLEHYSDGIDPDLLNVISENWAVQFQFSSE